MLRSRLLLRILGCACAWSTRADGIFTRRGLRLHRLNPIRHIRWLYIAEGELLVHPSLQRCPKDWIGGARLLERGRPDPIRQADNGQEAASALRVTLVLSHMVSCSMMERASRAAFRNYAPGDKKKRVGEGEKEAQLADQPGSSSIILKPGEMREIARGVLDRPFDIPKPCRLWSPAPNNNKEKCREIHFSRHDVY